MKYCEICSGLCKEETLTLNNNNVSILICKKCNLYQAKNIKFDYDLTGNVNFENMEKSFKLLRQQNFKTIASYMRSILPEGSKGLEVGSLHGWFLDEINKYYQCYGIEPLKDIVNYNDCHVVFKGFFPQDLPDDISELDFLVFNDVFEHIPDCNQLMKHCNSVLKDGGYLIINIPLSSGIFFNIAKLLHKLGRPNEFVRMWQFRFNTPHLYYFNKNNLSILAAKHNFKLVHYQGLDTLDKNNIKERIMTDALEKNNLKISLIKAGYPFLKMLNKDVGYLVFRKVK